MQELKEATKKPTINWALVFNNMLRLNRHPLSRKKIKAELSKMGIHCNDNALGVALNTSLLKEAIVKVKHPRYYAVYGLPEWIETYTKDFKKTFGYNKLTQTFLNPPQLETNGNK